MKPVLFRVELVWNREFNFVPYGPPHLDIEFAIKCAEEIQNSGDGARVKKARIIDADGKIVWPHWEVKQGEA